MTVTNVEPSNAALWDWELSAVFLLCFSGTFPFPMLFFADFLFLRQLEGALIVSVEVSLSQIAYLKAYPCLRTPDAGPRASIGRFSSAVDEARPQTPPIVIPKKDCRARNCLKVFTYPEPSSKAAQKSKLKTRGHFHPKRSERTPKMI